MTDLPEDHRELAALAHAQHLVATRRQLHGLDVTLSMINANLRAHRWTAWGAHVIVLHNTMLTRRQLIWAAILDASPPAALASHTALELSGFRAFAAEAERIHLLVERGAKVTRDPMVVVHESRRVRPEFHVLAQGLPCTEVARSALDAAAWQPWPRFACAMVAAVVQQRLCTPADLELAMSRVGRIRHKAHLRAALLDIAGGSEALSEIDVMRLCRRFELQPPDRQIRRYVDGRLRFLDAEWRLKDGRRVVLEIDGAHHLDVSHWQADIRRERGVVIDGSQVLRATSVEVRVEPQVIAGDLARIGIPHVGRLVRTEQRGSVVQF